MQNFVRQQQQPFPLSPIRVAGAPVSSEKRENDCEKTRQTKCTWPQLVVLVVVVVVVVVVVSFPVCSLVQKVNHHKERKKGGKSSFCLFYAKLLARTIETSCQTTQFPVLVREGEMGCCCCCHLLNCVSL